ncbi:hypothetical protein L615_001200000060 [Nocardioides sp. J9]|uniref:hypothetical protein n=1 Tax=Nocardioides sp. J9 TaxID=935844 RepID=UPI0011A0E0C3|nr:hypothetical protein [Nocardioides sp. J9]TWH03137.1 hypothetical protein L615_001200000060 [Nocardioides sp. J9]
MDIHQNSTDNAHSSPAGGDDVPAEIRDFLEAYRPSKVAEQEWLKVSDAAIDLVLRAGTVTRTRVEKDIQAIGDIVAHLVERGRPVTLDEALSEPTFLSYDTALVASEKTRHNKRGRFRRLQAVHAGLPWRAERREDGARVASMVSADALTQLRNCLDAANATLPLQSSATPSAAPAASDRSGAARQRSGATADRGAIAFIAAVDAARGARRLRATTPGAGAPRVDIPASDWARARDFACSHGWDMTKKDLLAALTHEALNQPLPAAVLIAENNLSRRDLDLALTYVSDLPDTPDAELHDLLRGA